MRRMAKADFFPSHHLEWFRSLPDWYEDEHAIYVHAGLEKGPNGFLRPCDAVPVEMGPGGPLVSHLVWGMADNPFYTEYLTGKLVVFGHMPVGRLPRLSPDRDNEFNRIWQRDCCIGFDTGSGRGGPLSALELPARCVHQSRV
jgi:serine/threonine protein phosphatase 1